MSLVLVFAAVLVPSVATVAHAVPTVLGDATIAPAVGSTGGGTSVQIDLPGAAWSTVDAGSRHTLGLARDGSVYSWGKNDSGQLGNGTLTDSSVPTRVSLPLPTGVTATGVAAGADFSLAVASDGTVWSWGANGRGQLGLGTTTSSLTPQQVPGPSGVRLLTAGDQFAVVQDGSYKLWSWGANDAGQLGIGSQIDATSPTRVVGLPDSFYVDYLSVGARHVIATSFYEVFGWGDNTYGQLGDKVAAKRSTSATSLFVGGLRSAYYAGFAVGDSTFMRTGDGGVYAFGRNDQGQLGLGTFSASSTARQLVFAEGAVAPIAMVGGPGFVAATMSNGAVLTWGDNRYGQLGRPVTTRSATPGVAVGLAPESRITATARGVVLVAAEGTATAWGTNDAGQLGDGTSTFRPSPVAVRYPLDPGRVLFGTTAATAVTRVSPTRFAAVTPARAAGVVSVAVETRTAGGTVGPTAVLTGAYTFTATAPPELGIWFLPTALLGSPYSVTIPARSPVPVTFAVSEGALPAGMSLDAATGRLAGTPTAFAPEGALAITATNAYGVATLRSSLTVAIPPTIEDKALAPAATGRGYYQRLALTGPQATVAVTSGALPDGISARVVTGTGWEVPRSVVLAGTPTTAGTFTFALTVSTTTAAQTRSYSITVGVSPRVSSPIPPSGTIGAPYSFAFAAAGSTPIEYSVNAGSLPPGLTLNPATGVLAGTPTATGRFGVVVGTTNTFAHEATDVVIRIAGPSLSSPTSPAVGATAGGTNTIVSAPAPRFSELTTTTGSATLGLTADGNVWAWGTGAAPLLSERGSDIDALTPARLALALPAGLRVAHLVEGSASTFLASDASVWTLDADASSPTGTRATKVPFTLPAGVTITAAAAGADFRLALASDGSVWAWGANDKNQLGDGTTTARDVPVRTAMPAGTTVAAISAAAGSPLAVDAAGGIWSWGVDVSQVCAPWDDCPPLLHATPTRLPTPASLTAAKVVSGPNAALVLTRDGALWSWGDNWYGQLGQAEAAGAAFARVAIPLEPGATVRSASLSREGAVAVSSDGSVWRWGRLQCAVDLGVEDCGKFDDGGEYEAPTLVAAPTDTDAVAASACRQCGVALTTDGAVWGWGANSAGQLGDGSTQRRPAPVVARAPFKITGVAFDSAAATIIGGTGGGTVTVLTPSHAAGPVDVLVTSTRPNGSPGPAVRYSGAFTYGGAPVITSGAPPAAMTKIAYSFAVKTTGTTPLTFAISAGALPAGLTLNGSTGLIAGTPTTAGTASFTVRVTNAFGAATAAYTLQVTAGVAPKITTAGPPAGMTKLAYSFAVKASGTAPMTYSVSVGSLPVGLTLNSSTGIISGTPTTAGSKSFTVRVANAWGTTSAAYTMTVTAGAAPKMTSAAPPAATVRVAYSYRVTASGTTPLTFSVSTGKLPAGLALNSSTGVISGTPTTSGTSSFTIRATNAWGTASVAQTLMVKAG
ncbi:RCC1 domain-containing protein [Pengzhenrongella sicca]|uniref:Putative Ig domain-containing protein n=1 Tax=Pengzhenrongella sicca TaxID=2819238 RepID=A0A8A4ZED0_9MICO|nr:putative Ig domain-containing protein [Pengzhenrongella sicca]QTE28058.1 putative Ig domain-containing protein [Pengzhenrongella sicca]